MPDPGPRATRPRRRRVLWLTVGLCLGAGAVAAAIHYRVGRNWLTYVGVDVRPTGVELDGPAERALAEPRDDVPGVPNFARLSDELYRGAQPTAEGFRTLAGMGVRTVVSLREMHSDGDLLAGTGLQYVRLRMNPSHVDDEDATAFLKVFGDAANLPAFVHCQAGSDRTGTMCAIYRVARQGWPADDAMKELPAFGFHEVWVGLLEYLRDLDRERLRAVVESAPAPVVEVVP